MVSREPLDLAGVARPDIDFLVAEHQRCAGCPAGTGVEHPDLHAEDFSVPFGRARHVGDIDDEMIERVDLDRHVLSSSRGFDALSTRWPRHALFVTTPTTVNSRTTRRNRAFRTSGRNCMILRRTAIGLIATALLAIAS